MPLDASYNQVAMSLARISLFRCNSVDSNRERRQRKRQWQKRRGSFESTDGQTESDIALEDNMVYTNEPIEMGQMNSNEEAPLSSRSNFEFDFHVPSKQ